MTLLLTLALALSASPSLSTTAERSGWKTTGRYAEAISLCDAFPKRFTGKVKCLRFGKTPEGRPMVALVASADGVLEPPQIRQNDRPVVYLQGGIHAGEIDGKDAGFWLLRELLSGKQGAELLSRVTVLFVPVFNIDGHERFGPNHRINQVGPEQMGWRVTGTNLNLNRDFAKVDTVEMAAVLDLLNRYDPILLADLHVTDGAKFQHDVAVMIDPTLTGPEPLRPLGTALQAELFARLEKQGHLPLPFYPSFREDDRPESGFAYGSAPPRFSNSYWAHRNRFGVLVETHSWRDYAYRVKTTRDVALGLIELAAEHGRSWLQAARQADQADRSEDAEVVLSWKTEGPPQTIKFQGYAFTREDSPISGQPWIRYDESKPEVWEIPYYSQLVPQTVMASPAGYLIPAAHAEWLGAKLSLHGFRHERLKAELPAQTVEVFRAEKVEFRPAPFEGRMTMKPTGKWATEKWAMEKGALFVPAHQPGRALLMQLLEPVGTDSFLQWGFFNAHFEQKEYMESYVAEEIARKMLEDPAVKAEFEQRLASDAEFSKSPGARLDFFYRKHPSYDERMNLYPVFRLQQPPASVSRR